MDQSQHSMDATSHAGHSMAAMNHAAPGMAAGAHDKHAGHSVAMFRDKFWPRLGDGLQPDRHTNRGRDSRPMGARPTDGRRRHRHECLNGHRGRQCPTSPALAPPSQRRLRATPGRPTGLIGATRVNPYAFERTNHIEDAAIVDIPGT
jgi:hypothetical protein